MRGRTTGKIVTGVLTVVFALLAIIYAVVTKDSPDDLHHAIRSVSYAVLSLAGATSYRYFED
jgi:preprotein translocase subunit SecG